jgi:hypothetical protein
MAISDGPVRRFFWRVIDNLDYSLALTKLRILDALMGPLPEMPEDQQRKRDREQLDRAFPGIDCKQPGVASADRHRRDG